jgi:hypothetical protein
LIYLALRKLWLEKKGFASNTRRKNIGASIAKKEKSDRVCSPIIYILYYLNDYLSISDRVIRVETQPTEMTYAAEMKSMIDAFGQGFHAEVERKIEGENLRIDLLVSHNDRLCLIVEVKRPEKLPSLNDEKVKEQAREYAEHLGKRHSGLKYFGTHNLKHLNIYKKVKTERKQLQDFEGALYRWQQVRPYPWSILPSASRIDDFQSRREEIKAALGQFLLDFKTLLEGKIQPIGPEIVHTIATQLEDVASLGGKWFFEKYQKENLFRNFLNNGLESMELNVQKTMKKPKR